MVLKLHNSFTRETEEFEPLNSEVVTLYTCGPTVYNYPHIGNYRAYIFGDILKRVLMYNGYSVKHVMNLTDVDDKTIRDSKAAGKSLREFTDFFIEEFYKDRDMLHIIPASLYTRATDYIDEMVALIEKLVQSGHAYKGEDNSIYFKISSFKEYGSLTHLDLSQLEKNASGRMNADEYEKDNAQDFALWKAWDENDGGVFWETRLGKGHPGWHIECSAMSMKNLGETIDIHTGGIDNMFPHHENEIAQSECATGKQFVRYWMHNQWLLVDGKKMSKSANNFYTLRDIIKRGYNPLSYRYLNLLSKYGVPLNFTWESLDAAQNAHKKIVEYYQSLDSVASGEIDNEYANKFLNAINDDLNTPQALGIVWKMIGDASINNESKKATLLKFDEVLGFGLSNIKKAYIPKEIEKLVADREIARNNGDWDTSDKIREEILRQGFSIKDTEEGPRVTAI